MLDLVRDEDDLGDGAASDCGFSASRAASNFALMAAIVAPEERVLEPRDWADDDLGDGPVLVRDPRFDGVVLPFVVVGAVVLARPVKVIVDVRERG
jgi:hypothetical protein